MPPFRKATLPKVTPLHLPQHLVVPSVAITNRGVLVFVWCFSPSVTVLDPQLHEGRAPIFLVHHSSSPASAQPGLGGVWRVTGRVFGNIPSDFGYKSKLH